MSEKSEIVFMQVRLLRLASEEWHTTIQKASRLFEKYGILKSTSRKPAEDFVRASIKKAIAQGLITEDQNFGFVSVFEYHEKDGISKYVYENADADWLHCIVGHRKKNTFSAIVDSVKDYDIVAGKIADDRTNEAFECISFVESEKIWIR